MCKVYEVVPDTLFCVSLLCMCIQTPAYNVGHKTVTEEVICRIPLHKLRAKMWV